MLRAVALHMSRSSLLDSFPVSTSSAFGLGVMSSGRLQDMDVGKVRIADADALDDLRKRRKRIWHPHPCRRQINNHKTERSVCAVLNHTHLGMSDHGLKRMPTLFAPTALTTASVISSTKRARFSIEPP